MTQQSTTCYLLEKNRHSGRRQPWPLPPPIDPPRPFRLRARVDRAMGDAPSAGAMKIERGVVYDPTIHQLLLVRKNRHPGRRQPWPLPPPIGPPRPFRLRARVNSLTTIRVLAETKNSRPIGFYSRNSTKSTVNPNTTIHKHYHHGGAVRPSFGVGSIDPPDRTRRPSSEGVGWGGGRSEYNKSLNYLSNKIKTSLVYFIRRNTM